MGQSSWPYQRINKVWIRSDLILIRSKEGESARKTALKFLGFSNVDSRWFCCMIDTNLNQIEQTKVFQHSYICLRPPASPEGLAYHISRYDLGWQPSGYAVQSVIHYTCSRSMVACPTIPLYGSNDDHKQKQGWYTICEGDGHEFIDIGRL